MLLSTYWQTNQSKAKARQQEIFRENAKRALSRANCRISVKSTKQYIANGYAYDEISVKLSMVITVK